MVEKGTNLLTGVSAVSGVNLAKLDPYKTRNARAFYLSTNKNLKIYIESYSAPDGYTSADFAIRGINKEGKAYTYISGLQLLKNYYNLQVNPYNIVFGKKVEFGASYPAFAYVQGNQIIVPFRISVPESSQVPVKGQMKFTWDDNAQWFSVAVQ